MKTIPDIERPEAEDPVPSAPEAFLPPVAAEPSPSAESAAWVTALDRWVDAELRSTPVAHHPPGWDHLINVALPKLRGYVERELKGS